jgi:hypothetical protein
MCMITVYKGSIKEENKIAGDIERYTFDLASGKLTVYPMLKEPQEFNITKGLSWDESNDSVIFE